ncbi:hypothetical protein FBD94_15155 [Pedobacter hiemivivus]|uniref:Uncharacterized protein n=1 Tax=Pedobacter hiemivivus TaxID=2530454 RepID=A0A4V5PCH0_9SPHI|nr:hypothetical protein [Pedobacter hiemivivus]TCC97753.1 hypothetical protein EZ444_07530 [Pedobacter hiemivivus]TKC60246.1 hypothetical protein FBD94_15155 [Pedobacter hiemivivus]
MKRIAFVFVFIVLSAISVSNTANAQCAMCSVNAEQSVKNGNTQGKGLNTGILYLLAIPYVLLTGIGVLWYMKFRKNTTQGIS